jgi:hypothetical protein
VNENSSSASFGTFVLLNGGAKHPLATPFNPALDRVDPLTIEEGESGEIRKIRIFWFYHAIIWWFRRGER